jgi:hypothetical protein
MDKMAIGYILAPHTCQTCKRAFSTAGNMRTHERRHREEKPFKCAHCLLRFTTLAQRKAHVGRYHNPSKQFGCGLCSRYFSTERQRDIHCFLHENFNKI